MRAHPPCCLSAWEPTTAGFWPGPEERAPRASGCVGEERQLSGSFWSRTHSCCFCLVPENVPGGPAAPGEWPRHLPISTGQSLPRQGRAGPSPSTASGFLPRNLGAIRTSSGSWTWSGPRMTRTYTWCLSLWVSEAELAPSLPTAPAQLPPCVPLLSRSPQWPVPSPRTVPRAQAQMRQPLGDFGSERRGFTDAHEPPASSAAPSCVSFFCSFYKKQP